MATQPTSTHRPRVEWQKTLPTYAPFVFYSLIAALAALLGE